MADELNVWMNGQLVGVWSQTRSNTAVLKYDPGWLTSSKSRALSLSLPITAGAATLRGDKVQNYFDNLLPDSNAIRDRIRARYGVHTSGAFELLTAIGRDCVGAVQLLPKDQEPIGWDKIQGEPLSESQVAKILRAAYSDAPLGQRTEAYDHFRISIAGAQEKTALLRYGSKWYRPLGATPTTHILKLPLGLVANRADMRDSVENEWVCSKILDALKFHVAPTEMGTFEGQRVLVVERFDRCWQGADRTEVNRRGFKPGPDAWIARVPQEDFCQVAGLPPTKKYEADGGPGMSKCLEYLSGSKNAAQDRAHFVLTQLAFWMLAAIDGHAKNFSISLLAGGEYCLTPLYDVLSGWPVIGHGANMIAMQDAKLAMALRSKSAHYKLVDIRVRHWQQLAQSSGVEGMWDRMVDLVARMEGAVDAAEAQLPTDFPPMVWNKIRKGTMSQVGKFQRECMAVQPKR